MTQLFYFLKSLSELVGARCAAALAVNAAQALYSMVDLHALEQPYQSLCVAMAPSRKSHVYYHVALYLNIYSA